MRHTVPRCPDCIECGECTLTALCISCVLSGKKDVTKLALKKLLLKAGKQEKEFFTADVQKT